MPERKRLTERGYDPKTASFGKQADPYLMNQERRPGSNPSATAYESGDPNSWAETPQPEDIWKKEYAKGRDEVGMGNFLDNTWKDRTPGSPYDNKTATEAVRAAAEERQEQMEEAKKAASKALHLTQALFPKAGEKFVMAQARDFMRMPPAALDSTIARIIRAAEEEAEEVEEEVKEGKKKAAEDEEEVEEEVVESKKKAAEDEGEEEEVEEEEVVESKKKSHVAALRAELEDIKNASDAIEHADVIYSLERRINALDKMAEDDDEEEVEEEEVVESKKKSALLAGVNKLRGVVAQGDDEDEGDEDEDEEEEEAEGGTEEEAEEEGKEAKKSSAGGLEIELTASEMDTTAGEGDLLDDIFTAHEKQASKKPKKGVSKLGGGSKTASGKAIGDDLSGLWKSDPDVSADFR